MNLQSRLAARTLLALGCTLIPATLFAQGHGGPAPMAQGAPGGGSQPGAQQGSFGGASNSPFGNNGSTNANVRVSASDPNAVVMAMDASTTQASLQSGLQLGPPERWWDEKKFRKMLELTPDQQRQLDAIFNANKSSILQHYQAVLDEQQRMEQLSKRMPLDEAAVDAEIDRLSAARAELEKANAHLLLTLRQGLDAKQIERLKNIK
jgi:Spy/CpxP family protein refolding chaperone